MKKDVLNIAFIHMNVSYGDVEKNSRVLIDLNQKAATSGADLILNTEMATTGFSFDSRDEIGPLIMASQKQVLDSLSALARRYRTPICVGLPECDPATGIFYNSAFLLGPEGDPVCRRRKITAEPKWACPGEVRQEDTWDAPWGRVGLMICSETYYGLLARTMALKDVDLILVPSNWPAGNMDVRRLWQARALENGFYLAGANRAGRDRRMDCHTAYTCLFDPWGRTILADSRPDAHIFKAGLPLVKGRIPDQKRRSILQTRQPERYHYLYVDLRAADNMTDLYYDIPRPGELAVHCFSFPPPVDLNVDALVETIQSVGDDRPGLAVLPLIMDNPGNEKKVQILAELTGSAVAASLGQGDDAEKIIFHAAGQSRLFPAGSPDHEVASGGPFIVDYGPARVGLSTMNDFIHPELAVAMSKRGCDLAVVSGDGINPDHRSVLAVKSLEKLNVAAAGGRGAHIWTPPIGHNHWSETSDPDLCSAVIDTNSTRKKHFQDRIDFELLFNTVAPPSSGEVKQPISSGNRPRIRGLA